MCGYILSGPEALCASIIFKTLNIFSSVIWISFNVKFVFSVSLEFVSEAFLHVHFFSEMFRKQFMIFAISGCVASIILLGMKNVDNSIYSLFLLNPLSQVTFSQLSLSQVLLYCTFPLFGGQLNRDFHIFSYISMNRFFVVSMVFFMFFQSAFLIFA